MRISTTLLALVLLAAAAAANQLVSAEEASLPHQSGGPTANLLKRSLCNTFGGCGAKRSLTPHLGAYRVGGGDETSGGGGGGGSGEARRGDENAKLISEILEDIVEHLQKDQNYKQGKYVMFVPRQTSDGTKYMQRVDAEGAAELIQRAPMSFRNEDELGSVRVLN